MAGMRTRDVGRAKKTYPTSRTKSNKRMYSEVKVKLEVGKLEFTGETTRTMTFDESYTNVPHVTLGIGVSPSENQPLVSAYITSITKTTCTVVTTGPFHGEIYVHAMEMSS